VPRWDTTPPPKEDKETLGERLKRLRMEHGLTQAQVGERLGYRGDENVSRWETMTRTPPTEHIPTLARMFGVSTDYLLTGRESSLFSAVKAQIKQRAPIDRLAAMVGV
jgi:transcriptional regulator with XRE-family HTH domain